MSRPATIARRVARTYLLSLLAGMLLTVVAGALVAALVVVARDDDEALTLLGTLATELAEAGAPSGAGLDAAVAEELAERGQSARAVEIWRDGRSLPLGEPPGRLGAWADVDGCRGAEVGGERQRVCTRHEAGIALVVATPLAPILGEVVPIAGAIALVGALSLALALVLGRRALARQLAPLTRFTEAIASLPVRGAAPPPGDWGAGEIDALAAAFAALLGRVGQALEREQRFTADAAHELRSPLTRVKAQLELYQAERRTSAEGPHQVDRIGASIRTVDELARMVEMLLGLARDEVATRDAVDLGEVAGVVHRRLAPEAAARVTLAFEPTAEVMVRGDPDLLALALGNLVDNALKYSDGPVAVQVASAASAASVSASAASVSASVLDQGPGLGAADRDSVRQPFVRGAERPPHVRGAGLGLALADHVARLHGGRLELANRDGGGLAATLSLPPWRPSAGTPAGA
ncbi:MAG: HAMP domain-containing sensor histidine kinase [Myxococcota bacterium]